MGSVCQRLWRMLIIILKKMVAFPKEESLPVMYGDECLKIK